jgi:hypothetical protein
LRRITGNHEVGFHHEGCGLSLSSAMTAIVRRVGSFSKLLTEPSARGFSKVTGLPLCRIAGTPGYSSGAGLPESSFQIAPGENGGCCLAFRRNLRKQKAEDHGVVFRAQEPNHQCRGRATSSGFTLTCRPLCFLGGALGLGFALAGNRHQHFALARCRLLGLTPLGR